MDVIKAFLKEWGGLTIAGISLALSIISLAFKKAASSKIEFSFNG